MIPAVLGFDTSNYRTSAAAVSEDGEILLNYRELLEVAAGERGLRQSDAVFAHLRRMTGAEGLLREIKRRGYTPAAVAVSDRPGGGEDSYMPVFQTGVTVAVMLSGALDVPLFRTTHQRGHLAAAAHGTPLEDREPYLAFHLSGGTTDLLAVTAEGPAVIGKSLDLHAGQLVDRIGVALGLSFPAGPELELLALRGRSEGRLGASMERGDLDCHFSGAESQAQRWIREGTVSPENLAREVYDLLGRTISRMLAAGSRETGYRKALVTGGVAGSDLFRTILKQRCEKIRNAPEIVFGSRELSGDNAVGVALIGLKKWKTAG